MGCWFWSSAGFLDQYDIFHITNSNDGAVEGLRRNSNRRSTYLGLEHLGGTLPHVAIYVRGCSFEDDGYMAEKLVHLNNRQVKVLRWIRDGCPDGIFTKGYEHRIIARALERRGLVAITGTGPSWKAVATAAGNTWEEPPREDADGLPVEAEPDTLIRQVLNAGGNLVLPKDSALEKNYEQLVRLSLKSPLRPKGKKLEVVLTGPWNQGPKTIVFTEHFDDYVTASPVPVPGRISRYHPIVKAYVSNKEWHYVSSEHVSRAARILQAIAAEASKRGMELLTAQEATKDSRYATRSHLALRTTAGVYSVKIKEISGPGTSKTRPRRWDEPKTKPAWVEARGWEFVGTGKLELIVNGPETPYNGAQYRDTKSGTVEDKLPDLIRSLEIYQLRTASKEQKRQREKEERHHRWETAMASAKEQYSEHVRWEHFKENSRTWAAIKQHRSFLDAARVAAESYTGGDSDAILQQLDQAGQTLDTIDPLRDLSLILPKVPEPTPEDLKPFLGSWSPYGSDRSRGF
ncbi:hypothetical protein ACIQTW_21505 [Paenarthrobacter sp. NPDC090517]|uniref:hypothetical protein n=1 Tax=Paenarthrobacter sp. NPDC090517 TaxID=3364381 RepID=UPI00380C00A7